jgi:hypothetical protein
MLTRRIAREVMRLTEAIQDMLESNVYALPVGGSIAENGGEPIRQRKE